MAGLIGSSNSPLSGIGILVVIGAALLLVIGVKPYVGPDAGTLDWSEATFSERAKAKRSEVRNLLQDQTFVSGIGNAYADEILWDAKLHPKRRVGSLTPDEMHRFYASLRSVIAEGLAQVRTAMPPQLGEKPRAHMQVRGRAGKACMCRRRTSSAT